MERRSYSESANAVGKGAWAARYLTLFAVLPLIVGACGRKGGPRPRSRERARAWLEKHKKMASQFSCRISAPPEIQIVDGAADAQLVFTNESESPVRVCTLCEEWRYSGDGWSEVVLRPDDWKSGYRYHRDSAKRVAILKPGARVSIPFRIPYMSGERLKVYASYGVGCTFAKWHDTWVGWVAAEPVVVKVAEDCVVAPTRPISANPMVEDLIRKLCACLPPGWEHLRVAEGNVRPAYWSEGAGTQVDFKKMGGRLIKQQYDMVVWFMRRPDYDPPGPNPAAIRGFASSGPARFIAENERVRAYLWGGWPGAETEIPEKLGLTSADLSGGAKTDNDLQIVMHPGVWQFEVGEPVWATVEFRYLDNTSDLSGPPRHCANEVQLSCSRGNDKQSVTVPLSEMRKLLPMRPGPPTAQWYSLNLNKHLHLSKPGRYEVRMSQIAEDKGTGRWHGRVRSNPLTIVMANPPVGVDWSPAVQGLRCGVRVLGSNAVELRLQNVGQKKLAILPLTWRPGGLNSYGGTITTVLLDAKKRVIGTYTGDRARDIGKLKKLAELDQPGRVVLTLEPGEIHFGRVCFSLHERDYNKQQWVRVKYDMRPYAKVVRSLTQRGIWTGVLSSPTVLLTRAAGRR